MNPSNIELASSIVPFVSSGSAGLKKYEKKVTSLLASRRLPETGWSDNEIRMFLDQMSMMDSNNFAIGFGEREGRVVSDLVRQRCFGMSHGTGRSGNLVNAQPKAAGSSLMVSLTNRFVLQMLRLAGDDTLKEAIVVPVATGMALMLCLASLKRERPQATHVVWCRCDQQSALKAISLAGLLTFPVDGTVVGDDSVRISVASVEEAIAKVGGADKVCCVLSTTSCFAPRVPDDIDGLARMCARLNVPHLINNAYGVQCSTIMKRIARANRVGRVDGYVQSADKNWCVPVGGAVVAGRLAMSAGAEYAGRASASSMLDIFITALSLGEEGWLKLLREREELFARTCERLKLEETTAGLRLLNTYDGNRISMALALPDVLQNDPKMLGSMLFTRGLTGHRVCAFTEKKTTPEGCNVSFSNWGQHIDAYAPCKSYLTLAVAIGASKEDVEKGLEIVAKCVKELIKKRKN